jgi:putative membrane protein
MADPERQTTKSKRRELRLFLTGLTMGLADLVPGVSGGTIAFLFGIYDELLYTVKLMTGKIPKLMLAGKLKQSLRLLPFAFLLPLGLGLATAIFGLVHLVSFLLETQPVLVWALFFGLVLGSACIVSRRITTWTLRRILLLVLGFVVTYVIMGLPSMDGNAAPLAVFATGAIAITAMILPGISGSLIMVLLGQYETIINAVADRDFFILAVFAAGALVGLALFVRLLTWLMKHYHLAVIAFLVGIMAGSLRRIWPWQASDASGGVANVLPEVEWALLATTLLMCLGFAVVVLLERVGIAREHDDIDTREFREELEEIEG